MILDHILSFLQFDLSSLFHLSNTDVCMCGCSDEPGATDANPTKSESDSCITNIYEPRPKIVWDCSCQECPKNKEPEEPEEQEDIDHCDYTQMSDDSDDEEDCERQDQRRVHFDCDEEMANDVESESSMTSSEDSQSCCQSICKKIVEIVTNRCEGATLSELQGIEERALAIWNSLSTCARESGNRGATYPNWWDLKSWQKLPFYWAALSNEILSEDPFENFKRFFAENKKPSRGRSSKKRNERLLIMWHGFCIKQRLPFIMEAFIAKVSSGKVNIHNEREIQKVIGDLNNK